MTKFKFKLGSSHRHKNSKSEIMILRLETFCIGAVFGIALLIAVLRSFPSISYPYREGVKDTHKEAFEMGLMKKEIDKDDKVIYRWIETHKLGYE